MNIAGKAQAAGSLDASLSHSCKANGRSFMYFRSMESGWRVRDAIGSGALAALTAGLASCAPEHTGLTAASARTAVIATSPASLPRAAIVAKRLAEAEAAYEAGDEARLARIVSALRAGGVRPHENAQPDVLVEWQQVATGRAGRQTGGTDGEAASFRGRLLGPAYVRGWLDPGEVWQSSQTFKSGETSTLSISHKGKGPVRMEVKDGSAKAICEPIIGPGKVCRFTPLYTQRYDIELRNEGERRAVYFLVFD